MTSYKVHYITFETMSMKKVHEGDIIPILFQNQRINAEVYRITEQKILFRHSEWEWIDRKSPRLFPVKFHPQISVH